MTRPTILVTLPFPDRRLNPNNSKGKHWASTVALRKSARAGAALLTQAAAAGHGFEPGAELALVITFVQPDRRARPRQPAGRVQADAGRRGRCPGRERQPVRAGDDPARVREEAWCCAGGD